MGVASRPSEARGTAMPGGGVREVIAILGPPTDQHVQHPRWSCP